MTYKAENSAFQTAIKLIHNASFDGMGAAFLILIVKTVK